MAMVISVGLSACSGKSPTDPSQLTACSGNVNISVSSGTTPTFTWTPECKVFAVLVEEGAGDVWYVHQQSEGIPPGVRYGVTPSGSVLVEPPATLRVGTTY